MAKMDLDSLVKRVHSQRKQRLSAEPEVVFKGKAHKAGKMVVEKQVRFTTKDGTEVRFTPKGKKAAKRQGKLSDYNKFVRANIDKFLPAGANLTGKKALKAYQGAMKKVAALWRAKKAA